MKKSPFLYNTTVYSLIFLALISCFNLAGQSEKSTLDKIKELRSEPDFSPTKTEHIDLLLELAKSQIRSNPDSSATLLKEGYDLSLETNYKAGESRALSTYGYYYFEKGEIEKAYTFNSNALKIANRYNLNKEKLKALNNMGLDFWLQGDSAKALTYFLEALTIATEIDDIDMMISLNVNIANLYSDNEDYEMSLAFLKKAHILSENNNDQKILAHTLLNMSSAYSELKKYEEAERMVDQSIDYFKKEGIIDWLSHAYELKGSIAFKQNDFDKAIIWLKKSEELCDEIDFKYGYTIVYNGLADAYLGNKNVEEAKNYALKGLRISTEQGIVRSIEKSNFILSKVYNETGNHKLAYDHQTKYLELFKKASTDKFKRGTGILRSKTKFENQKKQLIENQNKAIAKQRNYIYASIAAFLLVSMLLISIYRTNKLQKKYTLELQEKQKALLLHDAELSESNKTKNKLFSIIAHDLKGPINSFYGLMKISSTGSISKKDYDYLVPKALQDIEGVSELLNNLLVWAKSQMEGIVLKPENIDIEKVAAKTILVLTPIANKKEITIANTIPEGTISYSDSNHLRIILRNLISNAIKFTNTNGVITIGVKKLQYELQINVTDNGLGMDADTRAMLFKAPHMKSAYGTNHEKGTGLGLSICKEMVESNGGIISVDSVLHKGTTIYFTVPLASDIKRVI